VLRAIRVLSARAWYCLTDDLTGNMHLKTVLFILFFLIRAVGDGQTDTVFLFKKINICGSHYVYQNRVIGQHEFYNLTARTASAAHFRKRSKRMLAVELTSFSAGITAISFSAVFYGLSGFTESFSNNKISSQYNDLSKAFLLTGAVCMVSADIFRDYKKLNNKKIVKLYNQQF
jgi:predicted nucleotide-binding protein (sugar kinase/HSP70/actin superfamily)